ncbi:MAG: hypothetical protein US13_C0013G0027 [candidate division TM6 bacterium GW2011_GWE2_36_25]|nr:MAG: hypothetical protein US03_C0016G0005 [candidate division TM6 bacterium GW2011_GWF2_36_131]KKQ02605.1 MAG: hypothetical protein US13_C0013G0027 [candidate division TM6 bacterium GW2011_GWE2_36_25]KKQ19054.1 MAG: hypothetical protein US32_C0017G0005 [candidate division TM6 bacterium GW2011_GWA2_36_9]
MKVFLLCIMTLNLISLGAVTAEELYGTGYAYHAHTAYGLRAARR